MILEEDLEWDVWPVVSGIFVEVLIKYFINYGGISLLKKRAPVLGGKYLIINK